MFDNLKEVCGCQLRSISGLRGIVFDSSADQTHALQVIPSWDNRVLTVRTHVVHPFSGCLEVIEPFAVYNDEEGPQYVAGVMIAWLTKAKKIVMDDVAAMEAYLNETLAQYVASR